MSPSGRTDSSRKNSVALRFLLRAFLLLRCHNAALAPLPLKKMVADVTTPGETQKLTANFIECPAHETVLRCGITTAAPLHAAFSASIVETGKN